MTPNPIAVANAGSVFNNLDWVVIVIFLIGMVAILAGLVFFEQFALFLPNLLFH